VIIDVECETNASGPDVSQTFALYESQVIFSFSINDSYVMIDKNRKLLELFSDNANRRHDR